MSAAKSTLSDDVHHRMLPPWGLYFLKFLAPFPHHPHFRECVNHYDAMPAQWDCPINGHLSSHHGIGIVRGKMMYRH